MDVGNSASGNEVIAMDVARDEMELLVVTENGYGKRTQIGGQYRKTSRGAKGVKTIGFTEAKGDLISALVVRPTRSSCSSPRTGWCSGSACAASASRGARRRACAS
jgi:DNA gyrase/topoisomerase IV subunit A